MKKTKQFLCIILTILMVFMSLPFALAEGPVVLATGNCGAEGDNVTWTLTDDRVLTVSGTGKMADAAGITGHSVIGDVYSELFYEDVLKLLHENGYDYASFRELSDALTQGTAPQEVDNLGKQWALENDFSTLYETKVKPRMPKTLIVEEGVTSIGNYMFTPFNGEGILSLRHISLPSTLTSIGNYAFYLQNAASVQIPEHVESIGSYAFCGVPFYRLSLPASCNTVGTNAFSLSDKTSDLYIYNDTATLCAYNDSTSSDEYAIFLPAYYTPRSFSAEFMQKYLQFQWAAMVLYYAKSADVANVTVSLSEFLYEVYGGQLLASQGLDFFSQASEFADADIATIIAFAIAQLNGVLGAQYASIDEIIVIDENGNPGFSEAVVTALEALAEAYGEQMGDGTNYLLVVPFGQPLPENTYLYSDLTVHANPGSVAHQMALASGVKFECLNHNYTSEITKPATCKEEGICTYICPDCGNSYTEIIEKAAHTPGAPVKENEIAATTDHGGSCDEVIYCTVCQTEINREHKTTEPLPKPDTGDNDGSDENQQTEKELNFFQRIIEWFRNLFNKIASIFKR